MLILKEDPVCIRCDHAFSGERGAKHCDICDENDSEFVQFLSLFDERNENVSQEKSV